MCELRGFARAFGVAMDNARDLPGYKYYVRPDGSRPAVFVAFLDVRPAPGAVNGALIAVDPPRLEALDARERNYERVDVTDAIVEAPGRVWCYVGSAAGRERLESARAAGTAVVASEYLDRVRAGFAALGADELERLAPSLEDPTLPVWPLERRDLP